MANTPDLAPTSATNSPAKSTRNPTTNRDQQLEEQISKLQADLKDIAASIAKLSSDKISEARDAASGEVRHLRRQGQHLVDDVQSQAGEMEQQLKDTIREKPLTAVASAVGIGFLLALMSRR